MASCLTGGNISLGGGLLQTTFGLTETVGTSACQLNPVAHRRHGVHRRERSRGDQSRNQQLCDLGSSPGTFNPSVLELQNISSGSTTSTIGALTLSVGTLSLSSNSTVNVPIDTSTMLYNLIPASTSTLDAQLTGSGGLTKTGGGTLVLTGSLSNYTGGNNFNGGMVQANTSASLGTGEPGPSTAVACSSAPWAPIIRRARSRSVPAAAP